MSGARRFRWQRALAPAAAAAGALALGALNLQCGGAANLAERPNNQPAAEHASNLAERPNNAPFAASSPAKRPNGAGTDDLPAEEKSSLAERPNGAGADEPPGKSTSSLAERPSGALSTGTNEIGEGAVSLAERPSGTDTREPSKSGGIGGGSLAGRPAREPSPPAAQPSLAERPQSAIKPAPTTTPNLAERPQGSLPSRRPSTRPNLAERPGDRLGVRSEHPRTAAEQEADRALLEAQGHRAQRAFARAEPLYQKAAKLLERARGVGDESVAAPLAGLAAMYCDEGSWARAEPPARRALDILQKTRGPSDARTATATDDLAWILYKRGAFTEAEALAERALADREASLGKDSRITAVSATTLGVVLWEKGVWARAEALLARALAAQEASLATLPPDERAPSPPRETTEKKNSGQPSPVERPNAVTSEVSTAARHAMRQDLAIALSNLGGLYEDKGDHARAEPLLTRSIAIQEDEHGKDSPWAALPTLLLADSLFEREAYARAKPLYQRALASFEKAYGGEHPRAADGLVGLGKLYRETGEHPRAEPLLLRAEAIWRRALGEDHPLVADVLDELATLYRETASLPHARELAERALAIRVKAYGADHHDVAESQGHIASLALAEGDIASAIEARERAATIMNREAALLLATGSEEQKRAYMIKLQKDTDEVISLHARRAPADPRAARLSLATILQRKGRVLDAMTDGFAALRRRMAPNDRVLLDRLALVEAQLGAQVLRRLHDVPLEQHRANIAALETERDRLEAEVSARSAAFREERRPVTVEETQRALPKGTALVEIVAYAPFDERARLPAARRGARRYLAYVLARDGAPAAIDLGAVEDVDALTATVRAALSDPTRDPRAPSRALDAKVMQPIRGALGGARRVLLSPDGALNLIPFGALRDEAGRYLLETMSFTYLASGREVSRREPDIAPREPSTVIADPAFGPVDAEPWPSRRTSRSIDMANVRFGPLPGTLAEGHAIGTKLDGARLLLGAAATEAAVKALRGPRVVHIATHGFFLPPAPRASGAAPGLQRSSTGLSVALDAPLDENPLLRAGLAFAGANQRESGDEDGVLTALEASSLDLRGTRLIVLSACETGIGEASPGEGVYGMRRALSIAGAETQVMSLWRVDDEATRALMVSYYARLGGGAGKSEAMRDAQIGMLAGKGTSHPYYWASFLVSGDGGPLDGGAAPPPRVPRGPRGCACEAVGDMGTRAPELAPALGLALAGLLAARRGNARHARGAAACSRLHRFAPGSRR